MNKPKSFVERLDHYWYPEYQHAWDAKKFRLRILDLIDENSVILDFGAGRGAEEAMNFKGLAKHVVGVDVDPVVLNNPYLDEASVIAEGTLEKVQSQSIDVAFSCNVWEHVANPEEFLLEANRVLKPGGFFAAKTPNYWHYMPILASITPLWFHKFYNKLRGRKYEDTFPTVYKLNTRKDIHREAEKAGFEVVYLESEEGRPEYLRLTAFTYVFGYLYERFVNLLNLKDLRVVYYILLKKVGD